MPFDFPSKLWSISILKLKFNQSCNSVWVLGSGPKTA